MLHYAEVHIAPELYYPEHLVFSNAILARICPRHSSLEVADRDQDVATLTGA